jgi:outer membrane protein assembly factor BamB
MTLFKKHSKALTEDFTDEEVMVGSLCNYVYFINFTNGKISREPINVKNVLKGTMSLDPELHNLYVGQGVPHEQPFGNLCINLLTHEFKYIIPSASGAWRSWNAFDSSAIVAGGFLFWCSENGTVYKFEREQGNLKLIAAFKYRVNGAAPGIESSICVYRNYGFFTDNHGNVICLNLNTMKPVWYYYNHDDSDGSIVCKEENGTPFIYTGCEVDKQGDKADWHFLKLNALNGEKVWETTKPCQRLHIGAKTLDGGMYATPLMGSGDCEGMIFANICRNNAAKNQGELVALNTKDGKEIYSTGYDSWAWSSPIAFHNENAQMYIFTGDASGNVYLIKAKTGEIIYKEHVANNFESSPIAVGNAAIVGSRGNGIYKFEIK